MDWPKVELSDVCDEIVDCVNKTAPKVDGPTPYKMIRTTNVRDGFVNLEQTKFVTKEVFQKWNRRITPKKGDVILTREAPLGEVGMLRSQDNIFLGQRLVLYRTYNEKLDRNFLLYSFLGRDLQGQIKSLGSGATVEHLRVPDAKKLKISLPNFSTQKKIAFILSTYDDLIENNTRRIAILEEMAQMIYREWFVKFRFPGHEKVKVVDSSLGKIPEGWEVKTLEDECDLVMGQSPKSEFYNEDGVGLAFHQGVTDFGHRYPSDRVFCTVENRIAGKGDILISVRAPVGRINLANKKIIIGRGLCAIRHKRGSQWFAFHLLTEKFKEEDIMGNGAIFKAVTKGDIQKIEFLLPNSNLIRSFENLCGYMGDNIGVLTNKNKILRQTRDLLLPKLISGDLDVSDLDIEIYEMDEPELKASAAGVK